MALEFRSHYWDDKEAKLKFIEFTRQMLGLDLTKWGEAGFWDDSFTPFSFFEEGELVSNVCIYRLPMRVAGQDLFVPQVSTVATLPTYRMRGLNKQLTMKALEWGRSKTAGFTFLFADFDAFPFYKKCGFKQVPQHQFRLSKKIGPPKGKAVKLDPSDPTGIDMILSAAGNREAISDKLACYSTCLMVFHALYKLRDCIFWLPELQIVTFAEAVRETLHLYDVIGERLPELDALTRHLPITGCTSIEFGFMPDKLAPDAEAILPEVDPDGTHLLGDEFPFYDQPFRFPFTAHA